MGSPGRRSRGILRGCGLCGLRPWQFRTLNAAQLPLECREPALGLWNMINATPAFGTGCRSLRRGTRSTRSPETDLPLRANDLPQSRRDVHARRLTGSHPTTALPDD
ncbi:hypothetical protein D3C77_614820 [compost metagenome]